MLIQSAVPSVRYIVLVDAVDPAADRLAFLHVDLVLGRLAEADVEQIVVAGDISRRHQFRSFGLVGISSVIFRL